MTTIHADELQPGDVVEEGGLLHLVTHIDLHDGWAFPVAFADDGWAIAVGHQSLHVERPQRRQPADTAARSLCDTAQSPEC